MDESEAKENRPVTPLNNRNRRSGLDVVGSGSTWGAKERERFRIKTGDAVDVRVFVENKWFDFSSLDETQSKCMVAFYCLTVVMEMLRSDLITPSREAMLATELDRVYFLSIWGSFRRWIRQIYKLETSASVDIRAGLAREHREKNKSSQGEVIGRKETGIAIFFWC